MYAAAYSRNTDRAVKALFAKREAERIKRLNAERLERIAASTRQEPLISEFEKIHVRDAGDAAIVDEPRVTVINRSKMLVRDVAHEYGLTYQDLVGCGRSKPFILPRRIAMWRLRHERGLSFPQIGKIFNRDHSTCVYAVQVMDEMIERGELVISKQAA